MINNWDLTNEEKKELKKQVKETLEEQEKANTKENAIKVETNKEEKIKEVFDKIEFLSLSDEQKECVAKDINQNIKLDKLYIAEVFISTMIVTLWLLQNSAAVVIGAMLIAPILRPIHWIGFSIARWWKSSLRKSLWLLLISVFFAVFISFWVTKSIWINRETSEIIARTNPNVIDFFIAIFSAMVWVMSIRFSRLANWVSWVAMAVALLPPLSVIGIELAFLNYASAFWAFLLFSSNIIWIILVSTIFFWLYGFTPHDKRLQSKVFIRILIFVFSLIIILIPLYFSFSDLKIGNQVSKQVRKQIENIVIKEHMNVSVERIQVIKNFKREIRIIANIKAREWIDVKHQLENIKYNLENKFLKEVYIEFQITRVVNY